MKLKNEIDIAIIKTLCWLILISVIRLDVEPESMQNVFWTILAVLNWALLIGFMVLNFANRINGD